MEVRGEFHVPAALLAMKKPSVPIGEQAGWTPEPIWMI
jgi:hypothetical protein